MTTVLNGRVGEDNGSSSQHSSAHSKRVTVACDYCRKKRLKCTADQQPCTNCQLYRVECKNTRAPKQRARQLKLDQRRREASLCRQVASPASNGGPPNEVETARVNQNLSPTQQFIGMQDEVTLHTPLQDAHDADTELQTTDEASIPQPYEPSIEENTFLDFSSELVFDEPFDFWDPEISLHEMISMSGIPNTSTLSQPGHLTTLSQDYQPLEDQHVLPGVVPSTRQGPIQLAQQLSPAQRVGKISGLQSLKAHTGIGSKNERILPGLFIRKDAFNNNFIGLNSLGATLAFGLREISESNPGVLKATSFNWMIEAGPHVDELDIPLDVGISTQHLPPRAVAASSIKAYFCSVHGFYPVIDGPSFRDDWELLYDTEKGDPSTLEVLVLCLVIAIGSISESSSEYELIQLHITADDLFQRVWKLFPFVAARPTLATVQIALLQVIYLTIQRKLGMAWLVCGQAIRVAQSLGLHRTNPRDFDLTEEQTALRSRLWWVAFSLDAILSMSQGRPTAIHEHCYDTEPVQITGKNKPEIFPNIFPWIVQLAHIQNRFCGILCRVESVEARLDALAALDAVLMTWRDAIPLESRPEQEILVQHDVYPVVAFLHLEYYNLLRALHWACITSVPSNASILKTHPNPRIQASDVICLSAARQFVKVLYERADKSVQTHGVVAPSLHLEYTIAALAAIYRATFKNPRRISSKLDLEYFRAGKLYLEREIERTNTKPDYRPLFDDMLASLQEVLGRGSPSTRRAAVTDNAFEG